MTDEVVTDQSRPSGPPSRLVLSLVVTPLIILVAASYLADAIAPSIVNDQPALLIALNSRIRYLVLTVNLLDPVPYFVIGFVRNLLPDPLFFLLGIWYGTAAVRWMEKRTRTMGELMGTVERYFGRFGAPIVFLAPNNFVCLLAGAAKMNVYLFAALNISGTLARLIGIKILGETFEAPIDWALDLISTYRIPLLIISVAAVGFTMWNETRRGASEIERLRHLDTELGVVEPEESAEGDVTRETEEPREATREPDAPGAPGSDA